MRAIWIMAAWAGLAATLAAADNGPHAVPAGTTFGGIERLDPAFDALVPTDAKIEKLAEGFVWSEGPVWIGDDAKVAADQPGGYLLFNDIPRNSVMKWKPGEGLSVFLKPSGFTGVGGYGREPGANGLALDREGRLCFCEHGDRRVSVLTYQGGKRTLADNIDGKRLNSPNDLCFARDGRLYFTDPPYGLPKQLDDPAAELDYCGVYLRTPDGTLKLLTKEMTRPNGIALSPDEKTLYVAQSDEAAMIWKAFPVKEDGTLGESRVFFDATALHKKGLKGAPDGLKVDKAGNVFATGPGGVLVFSAAGKHLGTLLTEDNTANCGFGEDGRTLFMTVNDKLARVRLTTSGW